MDNVSKVTFKWVEETSEFNKDFTKSYKDESDEGYFLRLMLDVLKIYIIFTLICPFCQREWKL